MTTEPKPDRNTAELAALDHAIMALTLLREPITVATTEAQRLADEETGRHVITLVRMREQRRRTRQLARLIASDEPVPCLCGQCGTDVEHQGAVQG